MSASVSSQSSERFEFRKDAAPITAKLAARVVVMLISFGYVFGGGFDVTVRHFGKSGPLAVMAVLVGLIFLMPRLILRLAREKLVISAFGVTRSRGGKVLQSIPHAELEGYRVAEFRFASGTGSGISVVRKGEATGFQIPSGFADPQDLEAALSRFFIKLD